MITIKQALARARANDASVCLRFLPEQSAVCGSPSYELYVPANSLDIRCEACSKLLGENKLKLRQPKDETTPSPVPKKPRPLIVFGEEVKATPSALTTEEVSEMRCFVFDVIRAREELQSIETDLQN